MEIYQTKDLYLTDKKPKKYVREFELIDMLYVEKDKDNYIINFYTTMDKFDFQRYLRNLKYDNVVIYAQKVGNRYKMFTKEPGNSFYVFVLR